MVFYIVILFYYFVSIFNIYYYYFSIMKAASKQYIERISVIMKKRRIALDMKQSEAAEKAGISLGTLRKFEQSGEISLERFFKLCRIYQMDSHIMAAIENRDWWALEEIKKDESKRTVR